MTAPEPAAAVQEDIAKGIARGVSRLLYDMGYAPLTELTLNTGRRVDVAGLNAAGEIVFVEIKSSVQDYRSDGKWQDYLDYCDRFFFAVAPEFPAELLPDETGFILADRFGAAIVRDAPTDKAHGSRRRAVLLRFARTAAGRLLATDDSPLD